MVTATTQHHGAHVLFAHRQTHKHRIARMQEMSRWLDHRWRIPGTKWFIGMDGLIGLIPGIGDTITLGFASWIVIEAHQLGVPTWLKARMVGNIALDWLLGSVPLVGDLFDIGFQANQKNVDMLLAYFEKKQRKQEAENA